jgi:hypothetical protein
MAKRTYTTHDTVWDRDIPGDRKIGQFSGRPLPSVLSFEYLSTISMCQVWAHAKLRIAKGEGDEDDYGLIKGTESHFARLNVDPRDFGFEDVLTFDPKLLPAGTAWGRA